MNYKFVLLAIIPWEIARSLYLESLYSLFSINKNTFVVNLFIVLEGFWIDALWIIVVRIRILFQVGSLYLICRVPDPVFGQKPDPGLGI